MLVRGSKKLFLKWIGRGLRQKRITFPESSGPVHWSLGTNFYRTDEMGPKDDSPQGACSKIPNLPATREGESCVCY